MSLIFREANFNDINQLTSINLELQDVNENNGFLRNILKFEHLIWDNNINIYVAEIVGEMTGEIAGYIITAKDYPKENINNFKNNSFPSHLLLNTHNFLHIKQLAVSKKYQRQGIGSFLYISLFNILPTHLFFGLVLLENKASFNFQTSLGAKVFSEYWENNKHIGNILLKGKALLPTELNGEMVG